MRDSAAANVNCSLIEDLEAAIAHKNVGERAGMFRRVTDLFAAGSATFEPEQIKLFDNVMGCLLGEVDEQVRVETAERLAGIANAPPIIIRTLALDQSIEVAGPVLSRSEQVDEDTLIISATTRSQKHLLAISCRRSLSEEVTDVLVERGDRDVAIGVAANHGARFSEGGYTTLVRRSEHDEELAVQVWLRPEIPRQHLLKLLAAASSAVLRRLEAADRRKAAVINDMMAEARDCIETQARERSETFAAAHARLKELQQKGLLDQARLIEFAQAGRFDETTIALSMLCDLPIGLVERAIVQDHAELILVLGKAIGLSWDATKAILQVQAETGRRLDLDQCHASFARLQPETARKAMRFYRLREQATRSSAGREPRSAEGAPSEPL